MDFQQAANIPHDSASPETFPIWNPEFVFVHNFTLQVQDDKNDVKVTRCIDVILVF